MASAQANSRPKPLRNYSANSDVNFCGLNFHFSGVDLALECLIQSRYGNQGKTQVGARISIEVGFQLIECKPDSAFTGPEGYEPLLTYLPESVAVEGPGFSGTIDLEPEIRARLTSTDQDQFAKTVVYEAFLRIVSSYAIFEKGGLFMHSAAVLVNNSAHLFIGRSNAGKTTISRMALSDGHSVLSDDANMIYPDEAGRMVANAVPFAGELGQSGPRTDGPFPVAGIFWLEQAEECKIHQLGVAEGISRLMVCAPVLNVDPHRTEQLIGRLEGIKQTIPVATLRFSRGVSFNDILGQIIEAENSSI